MRMEEVQTTPEEDAPEVVDLTISDYEDAREDLPTSQVTIIPSEEPEAADAKIEGGAPGEVVHEELEHLPSIEDQRAAVQQLFSKEQSDIRQGTLLYVLHAGWLQAFLEQDFESATDAKAKLGPINTQGILLEGDLFCDTMHTPVRALTPEAFHLLSGWYGLAEHCEPVTTFAVLDSQGNLVPEFTKPMFYLHHLVPESTQHSHTSYPSIPVFSISRLHTCGALVQQAIAVLNQKERLSQQDGFENRRFRVWIIQDDDQETWNYQLTPSTFMGIQGRILIKKEYMGKGLAEVKLNCAHLCIEEKQVVPMQTTRKKQGSQRYRWYWPSMYTIEFPPTPSDGRIGLQNLGNTCYMNSALQCLVHIPELAHYFLFGSYQSELNTDNPLGMSGKVALSFANLIYNLLDKKPSRTSSYTPRDFKNTIGHFNSMFSGYQQQDSQEFLAFLLDGLHEDLNRIIKKPITTKPELTNHEDAQNAAKIAELAAESWKRHKLRNDSIIIDLFVGMYKSTLVCPVCDKISITFDPFNDLTLPLPVEDIWERTIHVFLEDGPIKKFEIELNKTATYSTLKNYVANKLNLNVEHLFTTEIWNHQFFKNFESAESQSGYLPLSDLMADDEIIVMYEVRHNKGDLIVPVINTVNPPSNIPDAFGVPFLISLTLEERKSFGSIRQKLEHRYEQLSTFQYFSKVRANQESKKFTIEDFPLLSQSSDDSGYDSDVSLANPEISGDYAFKVKIFDSSREVKNRYARRQRTTRSTHGENGSSVDTENEAKVWLPSTRNNFTNLPELLDVLPPKKKNLYTYGKKLDLDSSNESGEASTPPSTSDNNDSMRASKDEDYEVLEKPTEALNADTIEGTEGALADGSATSSDSNSTPDMDIEPLTSSLLFPTTSGITSPSTDVPPSTMADDPDSPINHTLLVDPHTALICEWSPELFDTFFVGLEGEGEDGKETWSNPETIVNEEVEESKKARAAKKNQVLTLDQCLEMFSQPEVLGDQDLWYCSNCKEHRQASKQIQIWNTPDILTIHLKRFQNQRSFSDKIDAVVDFPIEGLDMSPYLACSVKDKGGAIYDLCAVDNHYGGIGGGHYTAYAKNFVDGKWYYYNDSHVSPAEPEKSITGAAYLLFYRRRSAGFVGGDGFAALLEKARQEFEEREAVQLRMNEEFYRQNQESDGEDDDSDDEDESDTELLESGDSDSDGEYEPVAEAKVKHITAPMVSTEIDDDSSDNVSIPVGTDDEDDSSAQRRKQRLISRGKGSTRERAVLFSDPASLQSDVDSPAMMPGSPVSDDNCSTYSSSVNAPANMK